MDQSPLQQIVERLKQANTILVTVNKNPTVDQLAACIGLTLFINKLNKHAAAVFSGVVPSTIDFLQPEKTLEADTNSLRDFIISLDKEKADKLRYKVEDDVVKIFITPYKTSLAQEDFDFSQGDFNVEAIVALGVTNRDELDEAITAHGRILHDATVIGVSVGDLQTELGSINWHEPAGSSLSELVARLCAQLDSHSFDGQIATALMTGIVAETDRFRNSKTSPQVMQLSAQLMAAGANQQLIADKLEEPIAEVSDVPAFDDKASDTPQVPEIGENDDIVIKNDGSLAIKHDNKPEKTPDDAVPIEEHPAEGDAGQTSPESEAKHEEVRHDRLDEPPTDEAALTASTEPEDVTDEPSTDGLSINPSSNVPLMTRGKRIEPAASEPATPLQDLVADEQAAQPATENPPLVLPEPVEPAPEAPPAEAEPPAEAPSGDDTLAEIEKLIGSTHAAPTPEADETAAREVVAQATEESSDRVTPPASLNALPAIENINTNPVQPLVTDPNAPPPVPPPMAMGPQFFDHDGAEHNPFLNPQGQPKP